MANPILTAFHGEGEVLLTEFVLQPNTEVTPLNFDEKNLLPDGANGYLVRISVVGGVVDKTRQMAGPVISITGVGQRYLDGERDQFAFVRGTGISKPLMYFARVSGTPQIRVEIAAIRVGYPNIAQVQ